MNTSSLEPAATPGEAAPSPGLIGPVGAPALHVMSWNIRRPGPTLARRADRWSTRAPALQALLRAERPSVLGVQEALPEQVNAMCHALGPHYQWVGYGRSARGDGEGCPLFYDATRLELLAWEQQALSRQSGRSGSSSWGNLIPRILLLATFRDRATGHAFRVLNTHFDHLSPRSRLRSAETIAQLTAQGPLPSVVMGDLNAKAGSAPLRALTAGGVLTDTWARAARHDSQEWGTFANYQRPRLNRRRIDWILASPQITVQRAAINPQRHGGVWASDHLPVQAVLDLPATGDVA